MDARLAITPGLQVGANGDQPIARDAQQARGDGFVPAKPLIDRVALHGPSRYAYATLVRRRRPR
jgi:hypothetical protein